jgi:hypothetical protein
MKFNLVVSGIPVHGRVMKPRFQNMENWSDVSDFFTNNELIMMLTYWFLWVFARVVCMPVEDTPYAEANSSGAAIHAWNSLIGSFWQFWISPGVSNQTIDELLVTNYSVSEFNISIVLDKWAIERTSQNVPYCIRNMEDRVYRIDTWAIARTS